MTHHVYCSCKQSCYNIALCTPAWVLSLLHALYKCTRRGLSLLCIPITCPLVCVDLYGVYVPPLMRYLYMCAVLPMNQFAALLI